jgi:hypothetical protein
MQQRGRERSDAPYRVLLLHARSHVASSPM